MSINYGRSLPKGPRPKPPQPKLGEIGELRGLTRRAQRRRGKPKPATNQAVTNNGGGATKIKTQEQEPTKKKTKKKRKSERPKQNTPVRVEVVRHDVRPSINSDIESSLVVVEWKRAGRRYLAWGKRGIKSVEGWRECTDDSTYNQLLKKLYPFGVKLTITDQRIPVAQILDLIIATGKVLKPRQALASKGLAGSGASQPRRGRRHTQGGQKQSQNSRGRRTDNAEAARNEALVIRPSNNKSATSERGRDPSRETSRKEEKRRQLLAKQRRELSRLTWLRRNGIEERDAPDDMMHIALQGGSPGLKR